METHPPIHVFAAALMEHYKPKPVGEAIKASGLPVRKGKVRKNGIVSR